MIFKVKVTYNAYYMWSYMVLSYSFTDTCAFICAYTNIYMHTQIDASGQLRFQYLVQVYFDT